ncbi:MAG: ATP-dependent RecD-like DNA helicase, partial [Actinobacteria bacterium]|nr:ATP-dependent RecD-like DNA helicase [Actinomycetota bacterium]
MTDPSTCKICGTIHKIIYRNPDNDYFIGRLQKEEDSSIVTIIGNAIEIQPGERIIASGKWVENKKYGKQFEIEGIETLVPVSIEGIEKYLGSGLIKGIGPVMAARIAGKFGIETLKILDSSPEKLSEVDGFAAKRIELVVNEWRKQKYIREIMIFMQSCNISNSYAIKIYNMYSTDSIKVLQSNPYRLIEDVTGIGFKTADKIAENMGIGKDSAFRIKSGILYLLGEITDSGHCFYPLDDFIPAAMELLGVGEPAVISAVNELAASGKIVLAQDRSPRIYLKNIYEDETYVSRKLKEIRSSGKLEDIIESRDAETVIRDVSAESGEKLDDIQIEAVRKSIKENILIITGSPGTGKSTILASIIKIYEKQSKKVLV